jgi:single-strand DNA-binding protein
MNGVNNVIIIGNVGNVSDVINLNGGGKIVTLSIATTEQFININKEKKSNTQWHSVVLWNSLSDLSSMIGKGDLIYVEGRLNYRVKNTDNHSERYTEVVAKTIRILRKANSKEEVKIDFNEDEFFD